MRSAGGARGSAALAAALLAGTVLLFLPVQGHRFISLDDTPYVTDNPVVLRGLTVAGLRWALTTFHSFNWHPLTWFSHMADVTLFGTWAGGHHLTSVFIHAANAALLFTALLALTASRWRSAAVAALFAFHPLRVESVAWVAERKDVLCALFWMLTLLAYAAYARRPGTRRAIWVAAGFLLALTAKPMAVTLPFVLLLLDFWPLGRLRAPGTRGAGAQFTRLFMEKAPLFLLAAASSLVTLLAQRSGAAERVGEEYAFGVRAANAAVSCVRYLWLTVRPSGLIPFYPHPGAGVPPWQVAGAAVAVGAATALAVRARRRHPYLLTGWLWYLGTLVPVLGLVQVGGQALADRYTYLPLVGIFAVAAWGLADLTPPVREARAAAAVAVLAALGALALLTRIQIGHWRDEATLQRYVLSVDPGNYLALNNLGASLIRQGNLKDAGAALTQAYRSNPRLLAVVHLRTGALLLRQGRRGEALDHFRRAAELDPYSSEARDALREAQAPATGRTASPPPDRGQQR